MANQTRAWRPDSDEVNAIVAELRPLIRQLAYRDQQSIARDVLRRRAARDERVAGLSADDVAQYTEQAEPDAPGDHDSP